MKLPYSVHRMVLTASVFVISQARILAAETLPPASQRFAEETGVSVPSFQQHVVPLLGRLGCNGRACHGSFQGRGGFRLSLFGYDFQMDHAALTGKSVSLPGSRVDRASPGHSLILLKPTEQLDHEGGLRFERDSWEYRLLHRWIAAGSRGTSTPVVLSRLDVEPRSLVFRSADERSALRVIAVWADGSREDVTCLCRFRSNDDAVATVDSDGRITSIGPGDTHLIAFYDNGVATVPVVFPTVSETHVAWPHTERSTRIDDLVNARLRTLGLVPSPVCTDEEFLRRLSIDLTGTLPIPDEVEMFLSDRSPAKRDRKIDELLNRPAFAAWWANKLCDFTGCNPNQQAEQGQELAGQWYQWIYQRLRENTPYDVIVERIVLASGRHDGQTYDEFAAETSAYFREDSPGDFTSRPTMPHYWSRRTLVKPDDKALALAHSFLGIRLQCAQCHKHPWDQWTQDDFRQFSAFFDNVRFGVAPDAQERYAELAKAIGLNIRGQEGSPINPDTFSRIQAGRTAPWREVYVASRAKNVDLRLLRSRDVSLSKDADPREPIMQWMRDPQNPWFARAFVNRVWASCFSIGIIDPPDDLNAANPPSNPELLDALATGFVQNAYNIQWLLREITQSSTWQRSWKPNETNQHDRRNFSRAVPRRIPAEVLYDGIKQVVAASDKLDEVRQDLSRRAVGHLSMRMAGTYAMHVFGKPERAVTCDCERVNEPTLLQSVFMQNDPLVQMQLASSGWIAEIAATANRPTEPEARTLIRTAFLRAVGRPPTDADMRKCLKHIHTTTSTAEGVTDILWALLNTKEFLLNH